jgi:hypothetical protein
MLFTNRMILIGLLSVGITAATTAQAGVQLFTADWHTESFGNFCDGAGTTGPHCTKVTGFFEAYSNWALPQNQACNPNQPRCPFSSTPTDGAGNFAPLGGNQIIGLYCTKYTQFGPAPRPANGETITSGPPPTGMSRPVPPLYRNPRFFTGAGQPKITQCTERSSGFTTQNRGFLGQNRGRVNVGDPVAGTWNAGTTSATHQGAFTIPQAPPVGQHKYGLAATDFAGSFTAIYPYVYSYTYVNLRNAGGVFGPGSGPGGFNIVYSPGQGGQGAVATINVTEGSRKFGGTMEMLGALTTKVCYYTNGGCSLGQNRWRYNVIGASGVMTAAGVVTRGYITTYTARYYNTALMATSTVTVEGSRFPWTTGTVTVAATGRGPGDTVHYDHGYDNRNPTSSGGKGTIQLVSPIITRWFGTKDIETGGIGVLRIKFVPEPQTWAMLIAGVSLLGVGARMRGR